MLRILNRFPKGLGTQPGLAYNLIDWEERGKQMPCATEDRTDSRSPTRTRIVAARSAEAFYTHLGTARRAARQVAAVACRLAAFLAEATGWARNHYTPAFAL